ncbi:MAG: hypothetical protein DRJ26_01775 [Candidatus Methanomethylicota archaeon]|nr:MAG: hypothetical protein DRJ26_01775 [Candidatus Verstraetearchaeota archaeon]
MNIKYSKEIIEACRKLGLIVASFSREEEPIHIKETEGASIPWGIRTAIMKSEKFPDIIYDLGEVGKEPMIRILGRNAIDVVQKTKKIGEILMQINKK